MSEYSRISLRQAIEQASSALAAIEDLVQSHDGRVATSLTEDLDSAAGDLATALQTLRRADARIQMKAGALPPRAPGDSPAK